MATFGTSYFDEDEERRRALDAQDEPTLALGNIDMNARPRVQNADGSVSTVRTMGITDDDGSFVNIPTVSDDGRIMGDDEAVQQYRASGRHLGKYGSQSAADASAELLHDREASKLGYTSATLPQSTGTRTYGTLEDSSFPQTQSPRPATPAPVEDDNASGLRALANMSARSDAYAPQQQSAGLQALANRPQIPEPPPAEGPNTWGLIGAGLLDVALNRGRNAGAILGTLAEGSHGLAQKDYDNQLKRATAQAQIDHLYANRTQGTDPRVLDLRSKGLELHERALNMQADREKRLLEMMRNKSSPDAAKALKQLYVGQLGEDGDPQLVEAINNMTQEELRQGAAAIRKQIALSTGQQGAEARGAATKASAVLGATAGQRTKLAGNVAAATAAARLPYQKEMADYGVGIAEQKGQNASATREKAKAGNTDLGDQAAEDFMTLHPWLTLPDDASKRQFLEHRGSRSTKRWMDTDIQTADRALRASAGMHQILKQWNPTLWATDPKYAAELGAKYEQYRNEHAGIIRQIAKESNAAGVGEHIREELPTKLGPLAMSEMAGVSGFLREQADAMMRVHGPGVREDITDEEILRPRKSKPLSRGRKPATTTAAPARAQAGTRPAQTTDADLEAARELGL